MKNLTKALVASGLLLSISGCNQQVMDCLQDSTSQILGIDGSGNPLTINGIDGSGSPITSYGIDGSGSPITRNGIDGSGSPITRNGIDGSGNPVTRNGIDGSGSPANYDTSSLDASVTECLSQIKLDNIKTL